MAFTVVAMVVAVALSYLTARMMMKDQPAPEVDTSTPTLSQRGEMCAWVLGRRRVGPVIGWVGNRVAVETSTGGGKNEPEQKSLSYYEKAWHIICTGPAERLYAIYRNDINILPEPISRLGWPSGTFIDIGGGSGFRIYWGEVDQPVDGTLRGGIPDNPDSCWPHVCFIVWDSYNLGGIVSWPQLSYDVEVRVQQDETFLCQSEAWIEHPDAATPGSIDNAQGVNPAHALWQIASASFPHGCGMENTELDGGSFEKYGLDCSTAENFCPVNVVSGRQVRANELIGDIMQDTSTAIAVVQGAMVPTLVREVPTEEVIIVPDSLVATKPVEQAYSQETTRADTAIFKFADVQNSFSAQAITMSDDSQQSHGLVRTQQTISMKATTHIDVANIAVDRRQREILSGTQAMSFGAYRELSRLAPGQVIEFSNGGRFLVTATERRADEDYADVDCIPDIYSTQSSNIIDQTPTEPIPEEEEPLAPDYFNWIEYSSPGGVSVQSETFGLVSINAKAGAFTKTVYNSTNDAAYTSMGAGGAGRLAIELLDPVGFRDVLGTFPVSDDWYSEDFGIFRVLAGNVSDVADLSDPLADDLYRAGEQILSIGDEVMFVRNIVPLGGGAYRFGQCLRGRQGTSVQYHEAYTVGIIARGIDIKLYSNGIMGAGIENYVKVVPQTPDESLTLPDVEPIQKTIEGAYAAPHIASLRHDGYLSSGSEVVFRMTFNYEIEGVPDGFESYYDIEIYDLSGTLLRTIQGTAGVPSDPGTEWTQAYTHVDMIADFGALPIEFTAVAHARTDGGKYRSIGIPLRVRRDIGTNGSSFPQFDRIMENRVFSGLPEKTDEYILYEVFN